MLKLRQIELLGFKSFPNKTVVDFDDGVSCIVGPNGSGKSNISDAVSFAFGSQSGRDLRTANLSGLIFAGTETQRPLSMASVTLHFECSDYREAEADGEGAAALSMLDEQEQDILETAGELEASAQSAVDSAGYGGGKLTRHHPLYERREVDRTPAIMHQLKAIRPGDRISLTRRVFRDGTGGYFLNDEPVRLRDVDELFARFNLGRNAIFSVNQGEVEKKVLETPQELREWFAEATGIGLLLQHKRRAQDKLKRTEQNLERLEDIRGNTRTLVADLAGQREKAEAHLKLKGELRAVELNEIRREVELAQRQQKSSAGGLDELRQRVDEARTALEKAQGDAQTEHEKRDESERKVGDLRAKLEAMKEQAARLKQQAAVAQNALQGSEQSLNQARTDEADVKEQLGAIERELAANDDAAGSARGEFEALKESAAGYRSELAERQKALDELGIEQESLTKRNFELVQQMTHLRNELEQIERSTEQIKGELSQREAMREAAEKRMADSEAEQKAQRESAAALEAEVAKLAASLEDSGGRIEGMLKAIEASEMQVGNLRDQLAELSAKRETLAQFNDDGDAGEAASALEAEVFPDRLLRASDIRFDADLRPAFTRLLAHLSDALVTDSGRLDAIHKLISGRGGEAMLLIGNHDASAPLHEQSLWRRLEGNSEVIGALRRAVGEVLLADSVDEAAKLIEAGSADAAVLRDGSALLTKTYAYIGTPSAEKALKVARASDIEALDRRIGTVRGELEAAQTKLRQHRADLSSAQWQRDEAASALATAQERLKNSRDLAGRLEAALKERRSEVELLTRQTDELKQRNEQAGQSRPQIEKRIEETTSERTDVESKLTDVRTKYSALSEALEQLRETQSESATKVELSRQRLQHLEQAGLDFAERRSNLRRRLEQIGERVLEINNSREANARTAEESAEQALKVEQELEAMQSQLDALAAQRLEFAQSVDRRQQQITQLSQALSRLEQDEVGLTAQRERATERVAEQLDVLRDKYNLTLSQLLADPAILAPPPGVDFDASEAGKGKLREEKARLQEGLTEIGAVNLLAIDQHRDHSRKLEFMDTQAAELERAVSDLRRLIDDLDETTEKRYTASLDQIQQRFDELFQSLFEGGWARLRFTEEEDIINSGVEVEVQLPGGRRHSLRSLSGGQRSLIFLALFFAVHSVRSPGICVLDEADAALDDANVLRFAKMLKGYGDAEQVIIITHNKHTMEVADRLIGVVGRPKGVSNLLEVNLKQARGMVDKTPGAA